MSLPFVPQSQLIDGLMIRDFFAAMAMMGSAAHEGLPEDDQGRLRCAHDAYALADDMMKQRRASPTEVAK